MNSRFPPIAVFDGHHVEHVILWTGAHGKPRSSSVIGPLRIDTAKEQVYDAINSAPSAGRLSLVSDGSYFDYDGGIRP